MDKLLSRGRRVRTRPPAPPGPPPRILATPDRVSRYEIPSLAQTRAGLWVSSVGHHRHQPPLNLVRDRVLECYAAVFISRGRGYFESPPTGRRPVTAGTLMWVVPGQPHSYSAEGETWDEHWVVFGGRVAETWERQGLIRAAHPMTFVGDDPEVAGLFEQLERVFLRGGPLAGPLAAGLTWQLVVTVHGLATGLLRMDATADPAVAEALRIVERDATRDLLPEDLAQRVHVGYSTLRRRFKRQTGYSVKEYILRERLRRAKELLASSSLSVDEVARAVGFEDALYFSRLFKRRAGVAPTAFRAAQRRV